MVVAQEVQMLSGPGCAGAIVCAGAGVLLCVCVSPRKITEAGHSVGAEGTGPRVGSNSKIR